MRSTLRNISVRDRGLFPFRRHIDCSTEVSLSYEEIKWASRASLGRLVTDAFSSKKRDGGTRRPIAAPRGFRTLRVEFEVSSGWPRHPALIAHVHWHARRFQRLLPMMEADLIARPLPGRRTQLLFEGAYRPPAGLIGVVGDVLFGRVVARSTAAAFTSRLAQALEEAVTDRRCVSSPSASSLSLAAPIGSRLAG